MKQFDKGLNINKIKELSSIKNEPSFMLQYRLDSYEKFKSIKMPNFGPRIKLNFDDIRYYKSYDKDIVNNWNKVDKSIKKTFDKLGLKETEEKYLSGMQVQ